jgi:esterase/lipase
MLLPGHATVPGDLSVATLEDWRLTVDRSVTAFRKHYPDMLLGGYSLGGALAVDYVHRHPDMPPAGLVLIAPALDLDSGALWALPILNAASTGLPRLAWLEIHSDDNPVKYESFPVNGAWQMARLSDELRTVPVKARLPVWGALTADDATVNAPASLVHLCQLAATDGRSRLIWYGSKPPKQGCDAVEWQKTADGVLDYSHLALPFKPDNAVYGVRPLYYNCVHYPAYGLQWRLCKGLEAVGWQVTPALGEITKSNLQLPVLRRLTYNPSFAPMSDDLLGFIDALDEPQRTGDTNE